MTIASTAAVLRMKKLMDREFRLLIWLAECDDGVELKAGIDFLAEKTEFDREFVPVMARQLFERAFNRDYWRITDKTIVLAADAFSEGQI